MVKGGRNTQGGLVGEKESKEKCSGLGEAESWRGRGRYTSGNGKESIIEVEVCVVPLWSTPAMSWERGIASGSRQAGCSFWKQ